MIRSVIFSIYIYIVNPCGPCPPFKETSMLFRIKSQLGTLLTLKKIDKLGDKVIGYKRDGLKALAHPGGVSGMQAFERSKGQNDPKDELNIPLKGYYDKFVNAG